MPSPHHTTAKALQGITKGVAERLNKSGTYIYSMGEDPEKDRYSRFISLWLAVAAESWERAEEFFRDFKRRRDALAPQGRPSPVKEPKALAEVNEATKEVVNGYLSDKPDFEKLADIARAEDALRRLSEQIVRRGMTPAEIGREIDGIAGL